LIFIPIDTVLNDFAGNPSRAVFDQFFPSLHRKTIQNWLAGRNKLTHKSRGVMVDDFGSSTAIPDAQRDAVLEDAWRQVDCPPDYCAMKSPWHTILTSCERGLKNVDGVGSEEPILQHHSMVELRQIEQELHVFEGAVFDDDFDQVMLLLRDELDNHPLFNRVIPGAEWLDDIQCVDDLSPYFPGMQFNSFLFLLAVLDYSFAGRLASDETTSVLKKYLPVLDSGSWFLPLRGWMDELLFLTGVSEIRPLARAILGAAGEWENLAQNMYRWQGQNIIPSWQEIAAKLSNLERLELLSGDDSFLLLLKFGVARTIHAFHFHFSEEHKFPDEVLANLYAGYDYFFMRHSEMKAKAEKA
jgi:hypothetical protein